MDKPMNLEEILQALYDSEINGSVSSLWHGGIDVALGDELNGYDAEGRVSTVAADLGGQAAYWRQNRLLIDRFILSVPLRSGL
jgi:hypothetical protein